MLDRESGQPVFPMEEVDGAALRRRRARGVADEQVLPTLPPPFTRQRFTEDLITKRTPEAERAVREKWQGLRKGGEFDPPSTQGTILFPGMDGGGGMGRRRLRRGHGPPLRQRERDGLDGAAEGAADAGRRAADRQGPLRAVLRLLPPRGPPRHAAGVPLAGRTSRSGAASTRSRPWCATAPAACRATRQLHAAVRRAHRAVRGERPVGHGAGRTRPRRSTCATRWTATSASPTPTDSPPSPRPGAR